MAILYDSAFEGFCNKKESKFVIFKEESKSSKNPFGFFVLSTRNIITVLYCLLMFMHLQKNVQNVKKLVVNLE